MTGVRVREVSDESEMRRCHHVMRQLRPQYGEDQFVEQVQRQLNDGYRLAYVEDGSVVVAVAGYRLGENLAWGRYLYVDDLVTDTTRRSAGYGELLLNWLVDHARERSCDELHLDSGVQRYAAHRFYLRHRMDITSHHFRLELAGD